MKLQFLIFVFSLICFNFCASENETFEQDCHLGTVLQQLGNQMNQTLLELHPELAPKMEAIKDFKENCYNESVGKSRSVNILTETIGNIIEAFFEHNGQILENLTVQQTHRRVKIFIQNLVRLFNLLAMCADRKIKGLKTSRMGLTSMAVYSRHEFKNNILSPKQPEGDQLHSGKEPKYVNPAPYCIQDLEEYTEDVELPKRFNWLDLGVVSPVRNQGGCGSCYLFAAVAAMESQAMIHNKTVNGEPPHFSVQSLLNCGNRGCHGGTFPNSLEIMVKKGVTLEKYAPYAEEKQKCNNTLPIAVKADAYCHYYYLKKESTVRRLLMRNGPAAVGINAPETMQYLLGEPFHYECGLTSTHSVLLVGWTEDYWIIKNSYGINFGIDGYLYLPRSGKDDDHCGIQNRFGVPIIF